MSHLNGTFCTPRMADHGESLNFNLISCFILFSFFKFHTVSIKIVLPICETLSFKNCIFNFRLISLIAIGPGSAVRGLYKPSKNDCCTKPNGKYGITFFEKIENEDWPDM